jgi:nuclear pore complex protein Nup93
MLVCILAREFVALRRPIAKGAKEALEEQYWDVLERTFQARPVEAKPGGDPGVSNKILGFLLVRYYWNGDWEARFEVNLVMDHELE